MSVMGTSNILKSGISNHKEANEIKELLESASKAYYETEHKILSDDEYDVINDLYEKYTGEIVSGSKGTTSMAHGYSQMMSTLKKAKNLEEFEVWLTDTAREAIGSSFDRSVDNLALILSNKLDGNSILIEYEEGRAKRAVTRGKDGLGVDVTGIFARRSISEPLTCGIKYEAVCANSNMDAVSKLRGKELVDARSAITGILGSDNGDRYDKFIDLFPIDASIGDTTLAREDVTDLLGTLHDNNTLSCGFTKISGTAKQVMAQIAEIYERNVNTRINWDHSVDGLVIEFMDESIRERLGWHEGTSSYPKFARALKYPPYEKTTEALRIEFDIGKTGRITPCVVFASVVINGRTYQRTSIANYRRFKELGVGEGTKLLFSLSNDVIGYLDVLDVPENKNIEPWKFAEFCPECGATLVVNKAETYAYCVNPDCAAITAGKLLKWVKKIGFKGIADSILRKLIDEDFLSDVPSIYEFIHNAELVRKAYDIDGLGKTSVDNFVNTILSQTKIKDYIVLAVASPEGIGRSGCKPVCKSISLKMMFELAEAGRDAELIPMLLSIDGVSDVNANKLLAGLKSDLMKWAVSSDRISIEETFSETKEEGTGKAGLNVCITGKLNSGSRDQLVARLEAAGHAFHKSVGKNTNVLCTNDPTSGSDKNEKAKKLGIEVWSEYELITNLRI